MDNVKQCDLSALLTTSTTSITITNRTVLEEINKLKTNKSTGPDGISPKLLKQWREIVLCKH